MGQKGDYKILIEKVMKVFVVLKSEADEYNGSSVDAKVFGTLESAKAYMSKLVQMFKGGFIEWNDEGYVCEEGEMFWDWWEDGEYNSNHYSIAIREEEVEL